MANRTIEEPADIGPPGADHFLHSSLREKVIEHLFVGELLRTLWRRGDRNFEVLRSEVDRAGHDLVVECAGVMRHIQLKSSHRTATTRRVNIHVNLAAKPNGCVIWIYFDPITLNLGPYYWLGGEPGAGLGDRGDRVARHTRLNMDGLRGERPDLRAVRRSRFDRLSTIDDVIERMFG